VKDIHDVIKHAKFGDDRFRGSGVVAGQISAFPIDFAGRPYNTLTLPRERVMYIQYTDQPTFFSVSSCSKKLVHSSIINIYRQKYILCSHLHAVEEPDYECGQSLAECTATESMHKHYFTTIKCMH